MNVPRKVNIVKIPREDPIVDRPVGFGSLKNLHLELIENKKKLKKNIPVVSVRKKEIGSAPSARSVKAAPATEVDDDEGDEEEEDPLAEFAPCEGSAVAALVAATESKSAAELNVDADVGDDADAVDADAGGAADTAAGNEVDDGEEYADAGDEGELTDEQREKQEQEQKEDYIHKFNVLARRFPDRKDIPTYTEHDDLEVMIRTYDRTMKEISLENRVMTYRKILSYSFLAIEILAKYMKIDMSDFASSQNATLSDYDSMLIELGEKNTGSMFDNIPVEAKLLGMILFNTFAFWIMKNKGIDINKFYNLAVSKISAANASGSGDAEEEDGEVQKPKKKMKGPSLKR